MNRPYCQYKSNGKIWVAGHSGWGLCAAWNHATSPSRLMTDAEHAKSIRYARAIMNRIKRENVRYCETENGTLFPLAYRKTA